jgi:hypothetical protein
LRSTGDNLRSGGKDNLACPCGRQTEHARSKEVKQFMAQCGWALLLLLLSVAAGQAQRQSSSAGIEVNPGQVQEKAWSPPPAGASKTSSVGQNMRIATPADSDSWAEPLDVDTNGTKPSNLVWNGKERVLYSDSVGTFRCNNGGTGSGELLVAVNAPANRWGRPTGSGYWVASMDQGQCGVPADALWGCRFNAIGTATACGIATLDQQNNDLFIVTAER